MVGRSWTSPSLQERVCSLSLVVVTDKEKLEGGFLHTTHNIDSEWVSNEIGGNFKITQRNLLIITHKGPLSTQPGDIRILHVQEHPLDHAEISLPIFATWIFWGPQTSVLIIELGLPMATSTTTLFPIHLQLTFLSCPHCHLTDRANASLSDLDLNAGGAKDESSLHDSPEDLPVHQHAGNPEGAVCSPTDHCLHVGGRRRRGDQAQRIRKVTLVTWWCLIYSYWFTPPSHSRKRLLRAVALLRPSRRKTTRPSSWSIQCEDCAFDKACWGAPPIILHMLIEECRLPLGALPPPQIRDRMESLTIRRPAVWSRGEARGLLRPLFSIRFHGFRGGPLEVFPGRLGRVLRTSGPSLRPNIDSLAASGVWAPRLVRPVGKFSYIKVQVPQGST